MQVAGTAIGGNDEVTIIMAGVMEAGIDSEPAAGAGAGAEGEVRLDAGMIDRDTMINTGDENTERLSAGTQGGTESHVAHAGISQGISELYAGTSSQDEEDHHATQSSTQEDCQQNQSSKPSIFLLLFILIIRQLKIFRTPSKCNRLPF